MTRGAAEQARPAQWSRRSPRRCAAPSLIALPTSLRSTPRSSGLETKSKAPSLSARTADSTLPCAVMTATGTAARFSWIHATRSSPSPSGRRMSVRHRSKRSLLSSRRALPRSAAVRVFRFMRLRVRLTSSSRSGSSSTTSTTGCSASRLSPATAWFIGSPSAAGRRTPAGRRCRRRARLIEERRAVALRQLAGEKQPEARAAPAAVERLEDPLGVLGRYAAAAIGDLAETGAHAARHAAVAYLDRPVRAVADRVLERVLAQVPDDLAQLVGIDAHFHLAGCASAA